MSADTRLRARSWLKIGLLSAMGLLFASVFIVGTSARAEIDPQLLIRAEEGDVGAQYSVAGLYKNGRGVARDEAEAVRWYRLAADEGYLWAQLNLAIMYENGQGVALDETEALRWYRLAAAQGDSYAQFCVGFMYENGQGGVAADVREAVRWYRLAAAQGDEDAIDALQYLGND